MSAPVRWAETPGVNERHMLDLQHNVTGKPPGQRQIKPITWNLYGCFDGVDNMPLYESDTVMNRTSSRIICKDKITVTVTSRNWHDKQIKAVGDDQERSLGLEFLTKQRKNVGWLVHTRDWSWQLEKAIW